VQDRPVETGQLGEGGVGVERVPVAREAVEQRLVLADRPLDRTVGGPVRRGEPVGGAAFAAEAALAAYEDLGVVGPQRPVVVARLVRSTMTAALPLSYTAATFEVCTARPVTGIGRWTRTDCPPCRTAARSTSIPCTPVPPKAAVPAPATVAKLGSTWSRGSRV
jgi:hypothetical protein